MKKTCGNCACIEYKFGGCICILDERFVTGVGKCENWEPCETIELGMLRKENKLLVEAGEEVVKEWLSDGIYMLDDDGDLWQAINKLKEALEGR